MKRMSSLVVVIAAVAIGWFALKGDRDWKDFYVNVRNASTGTVLVNGAPADLTLITNSNDPKRNYKALDLQAQYRATRSRGFGAEVKRRIMLGTYVLSSGYYDAYYAQASRVRTLVRRDFLEVFKSVDILIAPTAPSPAFRIGEKADDPLSMYLSDVFTTTMNLAGVPALSLPCAFSREGLPIGCQFIGPDFAEGTIFRAARALESRLDLGGVTPALEG